MHITTRQRLGSKILYLSSDFQSCFCILSLCLPVPLFFLFSFILLSTSFCMFEYRKYLQHSNLAYINILLGSQGTEVDLQVRYYFNTIYFLRIDTYLLQLLHIIIHVPDYSVCFPFVFLLFIPQCHFSSILYFLPPSVVQNQLIKTSLEVFAVSSFSKPLIHTTSECVRVRVKIQRKADL